jgi:hypothetical protein
MPFRGEGLPLSTACGYIFSGRVLQRIRALAFPLCISVCRVCSASDTACDSQDGSLDSAEERLFLALLCTAKSWNPSQRRKQWRWNQIKERFPRTRQGCCPEPLPFTREENTHAVSETPAALRHLPVSGLAGWRCHPEYCGTVERCRTPQTQWQQV